MDGVTGIVTKPMEGAKEQGVEGFFKGNYVSQLYCDPVPVFLWLCMSKINY